MSVVQNPFIGRARNKAGGMVFSTWKGINVLKTKPLTVANPRTDKQLMRRSALEQIMVIARMISAAIQLGFKEQAVFKSAFNAFVGYNLRNAFDYSAPPTATLAPADILVSQGTISQTSISAVSCDVSNAETVIDFPTGATSPGQSASDQAVVVLQNVTTSTYAALVNGDLRSSGQSIIPIADFSFSAGNTVRVWLFFYNTASRKSSDSVTTTTVAVA